MSNVALFAWGVVVSMLVFTAVGLMIYGAILDGRTEKGFRSGKIDPDSSENDSPRLVPVRARAPKGENRGSTLPPSEAA